MSLTVKNECGQMAVEMIIVIPLFIMLFFSLCFFGKYSLQKEKVNMAARYVIWKVRQEKTVHLPACYSGITGKAKPSGIRDLLPSNAGIENYDNLITRIFHAVSNSVNNTLRIEVSSHAAIPKELGLGRFKEIEIKESLVINGSTWKLTDITGLIKRAFNIDNEYFIIPVNNQGE